MKTGLVRLAVCVGVLLAVVACGNASPSSDVGATEEIHQVPEEKLASLWSIVWDLTPTTVADRLADPDIELIVTGTVTGFEQGPILEAKSEGDKAGVPQVVMAVEVDQVFKGVAPDSGSVYVQLLGGRPITDYESGLPKGSTVGLYLSSPPQAGADWPVFNADAGRPAGEILWSAGPERFVVADGSDGGVVYPYLSEIQPDASFREHMPKEVSSGNTR